jgi:GntR family transcriptional regulator
MELKMNKSTGVPLYIQIKNQIVHQIKTKNIKPGQRMPTERELAQQLRTSRNTISSAYKLLEQEGVLVSHQGRGTFVAPEDKSLKDQRFREKLFTMIDSGLDEALDAGLSISEFMDLVQVRVKQKEEMLNRVKILFVECNIEQARVFSRELSEICNFNVKPLVLSELHHRDERVEELLSGVKYIFSTFNHVNEVRELTSDLNKEVYGVAVKPYLEGIVKIARYPAGTKFGLISLSEEFHYKFERNLKSSGLENLEILFTTSQDEEEIRKVINYSDVVIVSPGRCEEIKNMVRGEKEVIVFNTTLDVGSVKAVMAKLTLYKH